MKKIIGLCAGILALLIVCFLDGSRKRPAVFQVAGEVMRETDDSAQDAQKEEIRVLIKNKNYASEYHEAVTVYAAGGFTAAAGDRTWEYPTEDVTFTRDAQEFAASDVLCLTAADGQFAVRNLNRARKSELYEGTLELRKEEGRLLVINELPLERYLCGVVSSEMPSSYPMEALKAQAVCARTYAKKRMLEESASAFYADVDDSISYQVYNNQDHAQSTDEAVEETAGIVLTENGELIDAMYYSTSCGIDTGMDLSQETVLTAFLADSLASCEAEEPWYRWQTDILLQDLEGAEELQICERTQSGAAQQLAVVCDDGTQRLVEGEYSIREYLAGAHPAIELQNGERREDMELLPSAFFVLQPLYEGGALLGYHLLGGGYGHGVGMSQNGAKHMAQEGLDYREILQNYYKDATLSKT